MDRNTEEFIKWGLDLAKAPKAVQASLEPIVRFFAWHDMHPVAATMVLMEKFGHEWITWEAETLKTEIVRTFRATSISEHNWNKIQAVRTILSSLNLWVDWETFEKVIQALNNNVPRFDILQRCTIPQLMAGVDMVDGIRKELYGREIEHYVAACAVDQGITYLPEPLDFAGSVLSKPMYRCLDCGNVDVDDLVDGRCDFCSGRYQKVHNLDHKPANWIPATVGRNIKRYVTRDPSGAKTGFDMMKDLDSYKVDPKSPDEVQGAKLTVAYKYMQMRRGQLVEQLKELRTWVAH